MNVFDIRAKIISQLINKNYNLEPTLSSDQMDEHKVGNKPVPILSGLGISQYQAKKMLNLSTTSFNITVLKHEFGWTIELSSDKNLSIQ